MVIFLSNIILSFHDNCYFLTTCNILLFSKLFVKNSFFFLLKNTKITQFLQKKNILFYIFSFFEFCKFVNKIKMEENDNKLLQANYQMKVAQCFSLLLPKLILLVAASSKKRYIRTIINNKYTIWKLFFMKYFFFLCWLINEDMFYHIQLYSHLPKIN